MYKPHKGVRIFVLVSILLALSIYFFTEHYNLVVNILSNLLRNISGPFGVIISLVIIIIIIVGLVMMVGFLVNPPEHYSENNKLENTLTTPSELTVNSLGKVVINIPVSSGFKFAIGFMLGLTVMGLIFIPLLSIFLGGIISTMLPL